MAKLIVGFNDLLTKFPEIAAQWHPTLNGTLRPEDVTYGSNKKVWWFCSECQESWERPTGNRTISYTGCPYCSGQKVSSGKNDLATTHPEIAKQWHPTLNGDLKPTDVTHGSGKKVWWVCELGHEYQAIICNKTGKRKDGCPICSGRVILPGYNDLSTRYPEIAKLFIPELNNGIKSNEIAPFSNKKYKWKCVNGHIFEKTVNQVVSGEGCPICINRKVLKGYNDLQTTNPELASMWDYSLNKITPTEITTTSTIAYNWVCKEGHRFSKSIYRLLSGEQCPYCSGRRAILGVNDLKTLKPKIAEQWDYEKNGDKLPEEYLPNSGIYVHWKCILGHTWVSDIDSRTLHPDNWCPYCSNSRVWEGFNDLSTTHPDIASQWHTKLNGELKPTHVLYGSNNKIWWECSVCGECWVTTVSSRTYGHGCPNCKESKGEKEIRNILKNKNILFSSQKKFITCKNIQELPFDFYLENTNILIEFHGIQHYMEKEFFHRKEDSFKEQQKRDKIKSDWCKENTYELFILNYLDLEENLVEEKLVKFLKEKQLIA